MAAIRLDFILMGKCPRQHVSFDSQRGERMTRARIRHLESMRRWTERGVVQMTAGHSRSFHGAFEVTTTEIFKTA